MGALLLPLAMPAYVIAYVYTDLLEFAGPLQAFLRGVFGWHSARDYWFPEIRSMGGAIAMFSLVLYPYVYLLSRDRFRRAIGGATRGQQNARGEELGKHFTPSRCRWRGPRSLLASRWR